MARPLAAKKGREPLTRHLRRNVLMDPAIEICGLSKQFGKKKAVAKLDLEVPRGSIFALLGDNGAGKTTSIRMLTGLLRPDKGYAAILGQDCWQAATQLRHHVG